MEPFVTALAWVFGTLATALTVLRVIGGLTYSDTERAHNMARGVRRTRPVKGPLVVAVICWVWILTMGGNS